MRLAIQLLNLAKALVVRKNWFIFAYSKNTS